jgi:hypothetical protein
VSELARRDPAPLAIVGGDTSDRARDMALALARQSSWRGKPPLLLITTATADKVFLEDEADSPPPDRLAFNRQRQPLTEIYPDRTFRFCFSNSQMAEAVVDFVWSRPYLRPHGPPEPVLSAAAPLHAVGGDGWTATALVLLAQERQQPAIFTLEWEDDPYSIDLSEQFREALQGPDRKPNQVSIDWLKYSIGGPYNPNPVEAITAQRLTNELTQNPGQRPLLVLPAIVQPARRMLRTLCNAAPVESRN